MTIGFARSELDSVYMTSFRSAQKVANINRDPRASLLVEVTRPYRDICGALITGAATVIDDLEQVPESVFQIREWVEEVHHHIVPLLHGLGLFQRLAAALAGPGGDGRSGARVAVGAAL